MDGPTVSGEKTILSRIMGWSPAHDPSDAMSVLRQARIVLAFGLLFLLMASYKVFDLISLNARTIGAMGTITAIEGTTSERDVMGRRAKCNGWQTLHYKFSGPDGRTYQGKENMFFGDCRHRTGAPLIVYFDGNDPAKSVTSTGLASRRLLAIIFGICSFLSLTMGGVFYAVAQRRVARRSASMR
jgi:hypothetical protein